MSFFGGSVKRIQKSTITIEGGQATGTAAISAIDTDKTILLYEGNTSGHNSYSGVCAINIESTVQVKATRVGTSNDLLVNFMIIEFF